MSGDSVSAAVGEWETILCSCGAPASKHDADGRGHIEGIDWVTDCDRPQGLIVATFMKGQLQNVEAQRDEALAGIAYARSRVTHIEAEFASFKYRAENASTIYAALESKLVRIGNIVKEPLDGLKPAIVQDSSRYAPGSLANVRSPKQIEAERTIEQ
jgi:hypothetical protein